MHLEIVETLPSCWSVETRFFSYSVVYGSRGTKQGYLLLDTFLRGIDRGTVDKSGAVKHRLCSNSRFLTRQAADTWMCTRIYLSTYLYIVPYLYLYVIGNVCSCPVLCVRLSVSVYVYRMHVYSTSILVVCTSSTRRYRVHPTNVTTFYFCHCDDSSSPSQFYFFFFFSFAFTVIVKHRAERFRSAGHVVETRNSESSANRGLGSGSNHATTCILITRMIPE